MNRKVHLSYTVIYIKYLFVFSHLLAFTTYSLGNRLDYIHVKKSTYECGNYSFRFIELFIEVEW